jgi:CRP-like cAMP-binding protein
MTSEVSQKIEDFFSTYETRSFDAGQVLVYAGDSPAGIFNLVSGHVRQYDISPNGEEVVVNVFKPPAFFPMSWAINSTPNQWFYEAGSKVTLKQAPVEEALVFLKTNVDVLFDLLSRLYSGTDGLQRRMAHLMAGTARSRVLFELIVAGRRFGKRQKDGSVFIDIRENELARRSGLSRETVSRELQKIKKNKLIDMNHSGLTIKHLDKLEEELGEGL